MAFMKPAKEKEVEAASPAPAPAILPLPKAPEAPKPITLVMSKDGGLNGQCWRAGQTVTLDPDAADWFLAGGHATRAP